MIAWFEVVEAGTSGRVRGECLSLTTDTHFLCMRDGVLVLETEDAHGVIASVHRVGRTHVLRRVHHRQVMNQYPNSRHAERVEEFPSREPPEETLVPSTVLSLLPGVTLRYLEGSDDAPRVSLGVPVDRWRDLLLFAPNDFAAREWRCVPCADPAAAPRRLVFLAPDDDDVDGDWPPDAFEQACAAPPCATRVLEHHEQDAVVICEDTAGVTFDDIVEATHAQGAALDAPALYAILGPVVRVMASTPLRADADPWNIRVTFDGRVCFDGFLVPWLPVASAASLSLAEIAEAFVLGGLLGPPVPRLDLTPFDVEDDCSDRIREHRLFILGDRARAMPTDLGEVIVHILDQDRTRIDRQVLADAVERWGRTLPAAGPDVLRDLLRGLFPARVAAEEQLRELLAMLDGAGVAELLSE